ncbi:NADP-dependent oxidoreductase, partial [Vibrio anguillarum]|uniref:NADP-dependent oxidoreductase n=1 Tax=Vibrio anguillarum TaxID=55601 RepID=UPI00188CF0C3
MKALMMTQYGDVNTSLAFQTVAKPQISNNQVLIKTHAASINPIDYKVLRGDMKAFSKLTFPAGIGRDVSGVVAEIGANVKGLAIGDEVFSRVAEPYAGTLAEYAVSDADHIVKKPNNLSHEEAASIPLVGLTAYQALIDIAKLQSGEKVLIHAGSGGLGTVAIQLAKSLGAFVATTTSTANVDLVKRIGADQVIDYKTENYLNEVKDFDVVFDTLGGDYTADAFKVIKMGGRVVSVSGDLDGQTTKNLGLSFFIRGLLALKARKVTKAAEQQKALYRFVLMSPNGQQLSALADLYVANTITPVIDSVYKFDNSVEAFNSLVKGRAKGK